MHIYIYRPRGRAPAYVQAAMGVRSKNHTVSGTINGTCHDYDNNDKYAMTIHNSDGVEKEIKIKSLENLSKNSIIEEHNDFAYAINNKLKPKVTFETGKMALELAFIILRKIDSE